MDTQENNLNSEQEQANQEPQENETTSENGVEMSELEKTQAELAELKDKYLRQYAEFDNFRKRTAKERIDLMQTAGKDVIVDLLEVVDDMDRASDQMEKSDDLEQIKNGTNLVFNKFKKVLENKGLQAMDTKNADFDVEFHEAITEIPAPTPEMVGKVIDELQKGYFLNNKIIRHAKVVVGK